MIMIITSSCMALIGLMSLFFAAPGLTSQQSLLSGMKTDDEVHLQARVCAVKCYYESKRVMLAAMQAFQEQ
jgi:hypothetical protein